MSAPLIWTWSNDSRAFPQPLATCNWLNDSPMLFWYRAFFKRPHFLWVPAAEVVTPHVLPFPAFHCHPCVSCHTPRQKISPEQGERLSYTSCIPSPSTRPHPLRSTSVKVDADTRTHLYWWLEIGDIHEIIWNVVLHIVVSVTTLINSWILHL